MNILNKVTWQAMRKNRIRTAVTVIGILLSAAMFTAVTTMGISLWDFLVRGEVYTYGDYFIQYDYASDSEVEALRQNDTLTQLADYQALGFLKTQEDSNGPLSTFVLAAADQVFFDTMPAHLTQGRHPQNSSEIVLPECILDILAYYGMATGIGDTITMELIRDYDEYPNDQTFGSSLEPFTKTYTIVGYILESNYRDYDLNLYSMFTFADGGQEEALWHRVFLKTAPQDALALYGESYGSSRNLNSSLLGFYGVTQYANYNTLILALAVILCAIIMAGSVSLIYNAFSISVSERTKQFGLLSSVGATKKQLRGAVFSEAMILSAMGIPLGLLAGYAGIAITLHLLSGRIDAMFSLGNGTVTLRAILSPLALIAAAAVALITVLISAAIPARRATKISPMEAIRQKNDYNAPKKSVKVGRLTYRLFGLPGALAKKYYKVSRKKYRTTVISLVISIVLFLSAASFSQTLRQTIDQAVDTENFDMACYTDMKTLEDIRQQDFVSRAAYVADDYFLAYTPDDILSDALLDCWDELSAAYDSISKNMPQIHLFYLEDAVLEDYLREHGIDPEPYFDKSDPTALVCTKEVSTYHFTDGSGTTRYTYAYAPFREDAEYLQLLYDGVPSGLELFETDEAGVASYSYDVDGQGQPILTLLPVVHTADGMAYEDWSQALTYLIRWDTAASGQITASYYPYDPDTGEAAAEPAATQAVDAPRIRIGRTIHSLPFGIPTSTIDNYYYTCLILPMSSAPQELQSTASLRVDVSDYAAATAYVKANLDEYHYTDCRSNEEHSRTLLLIINVFSYGFIVLISLICVANVFNTVSTNVALRRRDFGMLRSTGFRERDLLRMMHYECMTYGFKSLLWGLPIGLSISFLIHQLDSSVSTAGYVPPWAAMAIAAVCVFLVVFCSMFYAVSKLRRENPIEAIRAENL